MISPREWITFNIPKDFIVGYIIEVSGFIFLISLFLPATYTILFHYIIADLIWVSLFNLVKDEEHDD